MGLCGTTLHKDTIFLGQKESRKAWKSILKKSYLRTSLQNPLIDHFSEVVEIHTSIKNKFL